MKYRKSQLKIFNPSIEGGRDGGLYCDIDNQSVSSRVTTGEVRTITMTTIQVEQVVMGRA
jgi:hypothetical protein